MTPASPLSRQLVKILNPNSNNSRLETFYNKLVLLTAFLNIKNKSKNAFILRNKIVHYFYYKFAKNVLYGGRKISPKTSKYNP
jgi:hypothetical protein